jgi:recombinational DNA repair protein (RecF pathway)
VCDTVETKRFTVLRRLVGGDYDLVCTLYGEAGLITLFVKEGLLPGREFFGVFEPFNSMNLEFRQRGEIAIPLDVSLIRRRSYLASNYTRFMWMSHVSAFMLRHVRFYDKGVYDFLERNLDKRVQGFGVNTLLLRLEFSRLFGIEPRFLTQPIPERRVVKVDLSTGSVSPKGELEVKSWVLRLLKKLHEGKLSIKVAKRAIKEAEDLLEKYIEHHIR